MAFGSWWVEALLKIPMFRSQMHGARWGAGAHSLAVLGAAPSIRDPKHHPHSLPRRNQPICMALAPFVDHLFCEWSSEVTRGIDFFTPLH